MNEPDLPAEELPQNGGAEIPVWLGRMLPVVILVVFCAAMWALHRELSHFHFEDLRAYWTELSRKRTILAVLATIAGYSALVCYDLFALRFIGQKLSLRRVTLAAFVGYAFSMNVGQSAISGGAVRMRLYTGWDVGAANVARIIGFNFVIGLMGQLLGAGFLFTFAPIPIPPDLPVYFHSVRPLGVILLAVVGTFFSFILLRKTPLRMRNWLIELPPIRITLPAVLISAIDWLLSGVVLFALLPAAGNFGLIQVLCTVMLAHIIGVLSMVPGGLGVFETVIVSLLPATVPKTEILAALLAFRAIYYLAPLILAVGLLGSYEATHRRAEFTRLADRTSAWLSPLLPHLLAGATFLAGCILLLSGATPIVSSRLHMLEQWLPLPVVELSHFLGSIVGICLLLLAAALRRRVDAAFLAVVGLLAVGIATCLLKGLNIEEAVGLLVILAIILPYRKQFHRRAALFSRCFTPGWWISVAVAVTTIMWIGFTAFERIHYHDNLWQHFGFHQEASRFLRASAGIAATLAVFALWQLLRPSMRTPPPLATAEELKRIRPLIEDAPAPDAWLAMLGDKRFLFSASGKAFLMFGIHGRSWIAMGDPIGAPEEAEELIWEFLELCDAAGTKGAFYEVKAKNAHVYAGIGMQLFKMGEEARIDLTTFSIEGPARRNLRRTKNRMERDGVTFAIMPAADFPKFEPELRRISQAWLSEKHGREKSFSLGHYDAGYLANFDFAVVRVGDRIIAFANLWETDSRQELSVDLMRHHPDAPDGVMDFLFINLMLWGQAQQYHYFNLGMAPLSGLENHPLAPLWQKIGARIFAHGEHFYNFQGLRAYKEKFDPSWEPRFLATRGSMSLAKVLVDTAALIGGSMPRPNPPPDSEEPESAPSPLAGG